MAVKSEHEIKRPDGAPPRIIAPPPGMVALRRIDPWKDGERARMEAINRKAGRNLVSLNPARRRQEESWEREHFWYQGKLYGHVLAVGPPPLWTKKGKLIDASSVSDQYGSATADALERNQGSRIDYPHPWPELEFGDVVAVAQRFDGEKWYRRPIYSLLGETDAESRDFAPADGGPERYTVTNESVLAVIPCERIAMRYARREWTYGRKGPSPQKAPLFDRVMIRNMPHPERSAGGILLPHWIDRDEPQGEVVSVGINVWEFAVGDWVLTELDIGMRLEEKGEVFTLVHEPDCLLRWDEEPSDEEKRRYSVELGQAF